RLVTAAGKPLPALDLAAAPAASITPVLPRFEDAFVARLGGQQKRTLGLSTRVRDAPDQTPPVEARALTRRFGSFTAADSISFRIARGEI
ncbi:hypothetical protein ACEWAO_23715, partial [Vibrio parahaemolyticus]